MKRKDPDLFQYYQQIWGERWLNLRRAIEQKHNLKQVLFSPFTSIPLEHEISWLSSCVWMNKDRHHWPKIRNEQGLLQYYVMDPASVFVARALEVGESDTVLDMCAAPGGKTLVLAQRLSHKGVLDANEPSPNRRERLKKVIQQYVPRDQRQSIFIKGKEGMRYAIVSPHHYSRVLVDAPCSGEKYLITARSSLSSLKENDFSRIRSLAKRQYGLLSAALMAVKPGGRIVYSTCALSQEENDGVVERLLKRNKGQVHWVSVDTPKHIENEGGEKTDYGWHFLPDRCGFGPMYFSVLEKPIPI